MKYKTRPYIFTRNIWRKYQPANPPYSAILAILAMSAILLIITANQWSAPQFLKYPPFQRLTYYERDITAYNLVREQTDDDPCIGAGKYNICQALERGERVVAGNFAPLGTKIRIKGLGDFIIRDHMNSRFPERVDIAMPADQIQEARQFGVKQMDVAIIN